MKNATAIDDRWLPFAPTRKRSPDRAVAELVKRFGKDAVIASVKNCRRQSHIPDTDNWWLMEAIREIGRQDGAKDFTKKNGIEIRRHIKRKNLNQADSIDRTMRNRFNNDKFLVRKIVLLATFVELWPKLDIYHRKIAVIDAYNLAVDMKDSILPLFTVALQMPDAEYEDRAPSTGFIPDQPDGALHKGVTRMIRDWLGHMVFP